MFKKKKKTYIGRCLEHVREPFEVEEPTSMMSGGMAMAGGAAAGGGLAFMMCTSLRRAC